MASNSQTTAQPSLQLASFYGNSAPFLAGAPEQVVETASGGKGAASSGIHPAISWLGLMLALVILRVVYELAE